MLILKILQLLSRVMRFLSTPLYGDLRLLG